MQENQEDTDAQKAALREMIDSFFRFAQTPVPWNGVVNDGVATVFHNMLTETAKCSRALSFVPRPSGGPASVVWLAAQLAGVGYRNIQKKMSITCAKKAVQNFRSDFQLASMGAAALQFARRV
ncbi:hypothetical protein [Paracidovorax konjaci]|uniref:Uncharacterized protein n=1 Tax=Paracidovorax konjaci TaxID=32040 RepID=A0A1I1VI92_9BURK|nr:hypothetical protein [Paracidovorax konjaci]SFD82505.1 hypothetical protein SAMN04489710_106333 [Paracidovorax konjaci]